jgi:hypothetical protein
MPKSARTISVATKQPTPGLTTLKYEFFARDESAARAGGRRRAMTDGWIGLRVLSAEQPYLPDLNHYWRVLLGATERRGTSYHEDGIVDFAHINRLARGVRVRTLSVGVSYAGGTRHVMQPGAVGEVVKREGPNVRVRFPVPAGHAFVYPPKALEVIEP